MDKMSQKYRFIQINLHHSTAAIALLCQNFLQGKQIQHLFRNAGFKGNE